MKWTYFMLVVIIVLNANCKQESLHEVSVSDFCNFVTTTDYITDAEKFGWSIVQEDIYRFHILYGVDWRCPDGLHRALPNEPVRQVSYNDAKAYADWKGVRLPDYKNYWNLVDVNPKNINQNSTRIIEIGKSNIIGNVWEITTPDALGRIRLAGGSYLCSPNSCDGTSPSRELYVDPMTGNSHISFAVIQ